MKLTLNRKFKGQTYTIGDLSIDGKFFCNTIEDAVRELPATCPDTPRGRSCTCKEKVYSKTAIPAGTYKVTLQYSPKYKKLNKVEAAICISLPIILSFYAFQEASKSCTTSMSACASCSFRFCISSVCPSFDFIRSMVLTLSRLSMFTMTCLGAAEDNRPVPE